MNSEKNKKILLTVFSAIIFALAATVFLQGRINVTFEGKQETMAAGTWTKSADFEKGTVGQPADGTSGFDHAGSKTLYSSDMASSGTQSARLDWAKGETGWDKEHGEEYYPSHVTEGMELWARGYYYFKSPWDWTTTTCDACNKMLRIHVAKSSGDHRGYLSLLAGGMGSGKGRITFDNEITGTNTYLPVSFDVDKWNAVEMYIKFSTTDPIVRVWKNGQLVYEAKGSDGLKVLGSSGDYADFSYIRTQWNDGAPQNQTEYLDDFVWTTETPGSHDAAGHPMIGLVGSPSPAPNPTPIPDPVPTPTPNPTPDPDPTSDPAPDPTPAVDVTNMTVVSPNGGEVWKAGTKQIISWKYPSDMTARKVRINLLKNGNYYSTLATVPIGKDGSGSYLWSVPARFAGNSTYRIKIYSNFDLKQNDTSDGYFTITR